MINSRKIIILHIGQALGGVDTYIRSIISNLDTSQFGNIIVHGKSPSEKEYYDSDNNLLLDIALPLVRHFSPYWDLLSLIKVIQLIKIHKPDIIHCHSSKGGLIGRLAAWFTNKTSLYTPHAFSYLSAENVLAKKVYLFYERFFAHFQKSFLLACSASEYNRALNEVKFKANRNLLWSNSTTSLELNENLQLEDFIVNIGRPSYQKNTEMLIEVMKCLHEKGQKTRLHILGVGHFSPSKDIILRKIREFGLEDQVKLFDWVTREETLEILKRCKLYVSTSRYEGLPYAILESMSLRKPVIATDCDGNRDAVEDGYNGYLIKQGDSTKFCERVLKVLQDHSLYEELSDNSKRKFEANFNLRKTVKKLEGIYQLIIKEDRKDE